eukprot:COSAG06_NODE_9517_length_1882_cov_2.126192_1_plen_473_part_01
MRQGGGYEQLEMAELEAEIAELQSELRPPGERGGGESPTTPSGRTMQEEIANQVAHQVAHQVAQLTPQPVHRDDSVSEGGSVSRRELQAALAEKDRDKAEMERQVAQLRQVVSSAKAVAADETLLKVLGSVDFPDDDSPYADAATGGPPKAPADRTLRETAEGASIRGSLCFTPDARTLVHGGFDTKELSLWDLCASARTNGGVKRDGGVILTSAVSSDGQLLCIATTDGLAMYEFTQRGDDGEEPRCELLWEIGTGTRFAGVAFSRDGALVAAVRWETGVLEIRESRSNSAVKTIEDFPAVQHDGHNCLAFSEEVLAVTGRWRKPNIRQVRLYKIQSDFAELITLEVPRGCAHSLAMSADGTKLAVGMDGGSMEELAIFSSTNGWGDPPQILSNPQAEPQHLCSTAFSHDGRFLCAGYVPSNQFAIWDVEAAVCVRVIQTEDFSACAFSPAGDLLATGGEHGNPVLVHALLP